MWVKVIMSHHLKPASKQHAVMDFSKLLEPNNAMMEIQHHSMVVMQHVSLKQDIYVQYHLYCRVLVPNCAEMANKIQTLLGILLIQNNVMMETLQTMMGAHLNALLKQIYILVYHIFHLFVLNFVEIPN